MAKRRSRRSTRQVADEARTTSGGEIPRPLDGVAGSSMVPQVLLGAVNGIETVTVGALQLARNVLVSAVSGAADIGAEAVTATFAGTRGVVAAASRMATSRPRRRAHCRRPCRAPSSRRVAFSGGWRRGVLSLGWFPARSLQREATPCSIGRPRAAGQHGRGRPANRAPLSPPDRPAFLSSDGTALPPEDGCLHVAQTVCHFAFIGGVQGLSSTRRTIGSNVPMGSFS